MLSLKDLTGAVLLLELLTLPTCLIKPAGTYLLKFKPPNIVYIISPRTQYSRKLRERGHPFVVPLCANNLSRFSFVNNCLFEYF